MHTSPLAQPGNGDAGGMNVYIASLVQAMLTLDQNLQIEIFTLNTAHDADGYQRKQWGERCVVHTLVLEQDRGARKEDLPALIPDFAREMKRRAVATPDVLHSHYWLSGLAASLYAPYLPWVHTMHTTAAGKNARAGRGELLEPHERLEAEQFITDTCSALVVNTEHEADQMRKYYGAAAKKIHVIQPGVDRDIFYPAPKNNDSRNAAKLLFAGRPQPLKGPHILIEALALVPRQLDVHLTLVGKSHNSYEEQLLQRAQELGLSDKVIIHPAVTAAQLAQLMREADIVACPSSSETFGLVALEAQSTGTPVLATAVDGLRTAVAHRISGMLIDSRDPADWAEAIANLVQNPHLRHELGRAGARRTATMGWEQASRASLDLYASLID